MAETFPDWVEKSKIEFEGTATRPERDLDMLPFGPFEFQVAEDTVPFKELEDASAAVLPEVSLNL
jgi:hypothetical protein